MTGETPEFSSVEGQEEQQLASGNNNQEYYRCGVQQEATGIRNHSPDGKSPDAPFDTSEADNQTENHPSENPIHSPTSDPEELSADYRLNKPSPYSTSNSPINVPHEEHRPFEPHHVTAETASFAVDQKDSEDQEFIKSLSSIVDAESNEVFQGDHNENTSGSSALGLGSDSKYIMVSSSIGYASDGTEPNSQQAKPPVNFTHAQDLSKSRGDDRRSFQGSQEDDAIASTTSDQEHPKPGEESADATSEVETEKNNTIQSHSARKAALIPPHEFGNAEPESGDTPGPRSLHEKRDFKSDSIVQDPVPGGNQDDTLQIAPEVATAFNDTHQRADLGLEMGTQTMSLNNDKLPRYECPRRHL
ncbi:hypothetical protein BDW68DRAFT_182458 [Aspergillus falconensis]